jgi:hypothetical protein
VLALPFLFAENDKSCTGLPKEIALEEMSAHEKAAYDATGILLMRRQEDGNLTNGTGLLVKMFDNLPNTPTHYGILTVSHVAYDDKGSLFIDQGVFMSEVGPNYIEIDVSKMPRRFDNKRAEDDIAILPLKGFNINTSTVRPIAYGKVKYNRKAEGFSYTTVFSLLDPNENKLQKHMIKGLCTKLTPLSRNHKIITISNFASSDGMSGAPIIHIGANTIEILGIIKGSTKKEFCDNNTDIDCTTYVVRP